VDRLDGVSRKYSLLISVDKTKVMASDGIACRILIQNELLEQVDTFPYTVSLITEDGECTTEFRTRLNRGQAIGASLQKIWKNHSIPISTKIRVVNTKNCSLSIVLTATDQKPQKSLKGDNGGNPAITLPECQRDAE